MPRFFVSFIILLVSLCPTVQAQTPYIIRSLEQKTSLTPYLQSLEDPNEIYTINQFLKGNDGAFSSVDERRLSIGYNHAAYWFRFQVANLSGQEGTWYVDQNDPYAKVFDIYQVDMGGNVKVSHSGSLQPFSSREVAHRDIVFKLNLKPGEVKTVYIFDKNDPLRVDLSLWSPSVFQSRVQNEYLIFGMFFGILLVIFVYNCYLFFSLADRSYFWYIIYLVSIIAFHVSTTFIGYEFLWPDQPYWNQISQNLLPALVFLFASIFTLQFLEAEKHLSHFRFILYAYFVLSCVIFVASFFSYNWFFNRVCIVFLNVEMVGCPVTFIVAAFLAYKKEFKPARYHGLGFAVLILTTVTYGLKEQGIFPAVLVTNYSIQIGTAIQVILLSFALSERINSLKEKLEASQKESIENLKKADYLKDEFLANTSHELRTPLHGIIGLAESLWESSRSLRSSPATKENLAMIISSGRRLALLVDDILDFSKLKKHELVIANQSVSLQLVIRTALSILRHSAEAKKLVLNAEVPEDVPAVLGDFNRLQQIVINLVGNAIKFTHQGGITVLAKTDGDWVCVEVRDTGIGIAKENFARIFQSFEQVESSISRTYGGTGIGLVITKKLVELHQGQIWFESEWERGTSFFFTLKLSGRPPEPDLIMERNSRPHIVAVNQEPLVAALPEISKIGYKIMTVDDELVNQRVLRSQLDAGGFVAVPCMSGHEALQKLADGPLPDLVLLDLMLPKMSGFEVCQKIREKYSLLELPVILITAKNTESDLVKGLESGANDYITKPCPKGELLSRIRLHIQMAQQHKA